MSASGLQVETAVELTALQPLRETPLLTAYPFFPDSEELMGEIAKIIDRRYLTNRGPVVVEFERQIGNFIGIDPSRVATCANATLGLEVLLKTLGLKGQVIVPSFTFVATVHAIVNAGLEPVFADIDPQTMCLSPEAVEKLLSPRVSAVMPVHVYGNICDIDYFEGLRARGIRVIYDAAHAFGVRKSGEVCGGWGDAEVFSFHATKIVNACEGGAVCARDPDLARQFRLMTNFGILNETEVEIVGTNAKMSEIHAAFGLYSLSKLSLAVEARKRVDAIYRESLAGTMGLSFIHRQSDVEHNAQYFPIFLDSQSTRDGLYLFLKEQKIMSRKYFFPPIHLLAPYAPMNYSLPVTEDVSRRVLCLPLHSDMNTNDALMVAERVHSYLYRL